MFLSHGCLLLLLLLLSGCVKLSRELPKTLTTDIPTAGDRILTLLSDRRITGSEQVHSRCSCLSRESRRVGCTAVSDRDVSILLTPGAPPIYELGNLGSTTGSTAYWMVSL